jgi:hypothetical protein
MKNTIIIIIVTNHFIEQTKQTNISNNLKREGKGGDGSFSLQMGIELGGETKERMQPGRTLAVALYAT